MRRTESTGPPPGESPAETTNPFDTTSVSRAPRIGVTGLVQASFPVLALNACIAPRGSLAEPQSFPPTTTRPPPTAIESSRSCDDTLVLCRQRRCPVAASYFATKPPPATYTLPPG